MNSYQILQQLEMWGGVQNTVVPTQMGGSRLHGGLRDNGQRASAYCGGSGGVGSRVIGENSDGKV